jgi:outer membrane protein assembly factor BamB
MRLTTISRVVVVLAGLFHFASPALAQAGGAATMPTEWLQLRNGSDNNGTSPGTFLAAWRYHAPFPVRGLAVANGVVIIGTESADAEGDARAPDQHGELTVLDAATGRARWTRQIPSWIHGDPVIYQGVAYVAFGRWPMSSPGGVAAYELASGKPRWFNRTTTGSMPGPALDTISGSLLLAGGDGVLYQLAPTDGKVLSATGLRAADAMSSPRVLPDGSAIMAAGDVVVRYDIARGTFTWRFHPPLLRALGDVPVAVTDSTVFVTGTRTVGLRNAARVLPMRDFLRLAAEAARTKHLSSYRGWYQEQWLIALNRRTGKQRWRRALGVGLQVPRNTAGSPVVAGGRVIVSSPVSLRVSAFSVRTGTLLWTHVSPASHKGAVTVVGHDVVYGDKTGQLHILRLVDGVEIGTCSAGGGFTPTAPIIVGHTIVLATRDGWVHATPYDSLRARALQHAPTCFAPDAPATLAVSHAAGRSP